MRNNFDEQLDKLNNLLIEMGGYIETAINMAMSAMENQNVEEARKAIEFDNDIDAMEKDIEQLCLRLLLQQQPVASDLRLISSALKMITDMERIGDHAEDISEMTILLSKKPYIRKLELLPQMAQAAVKMVTDAIDAFIWRDLEKAAAVKRADDIVDRLFDMVKFDLIDMIRMDGDNGEQAIDLIMIAKYLERIGDHAVNIAEWVAFSITGNHELENIASRSSDVS
jgi:phosphate transport system protein